MVSILLIEKITLLFEILIFRQFCRSLGSAAEGGWHHSPPPSLPYLRHCSDLKQAFMLSIPTGLEEAVVREFEPSFHSGNTTWFGRVKKYCVSLSLAFTLAI
jgi:hypothetical protein